MDPFLSIDLETTGLDPEVCQVIEVGAVMVYPTLAPDAWPVFQTFVRHKVYHSDDPVALAMNAEIFKILAAQPETEKFCCVEDVMPLLGSWLAKQGVRRRQKLYIAGKNAGAFDLQFLKKLPHYQDSVLFHHRLYDPAMRYMLKTDAGPPGLRACLERAGMKARNLHRAVGDALDVAELVIRSFK
jgi:DNA polymerase III epsilon subunit-like protein